MLLRQQSVVALQGQSVFSLERHAAARSRPAGSALFATGWKRMPWLMPPRADLALVNCIVDEDEGTLLLSIDRIFRISLLDRFGVPRHLSEIPRTGLFRSARRRTGRARACRVDALPERRTRRKRHLLILPGEGVRCGAMPGDAHAGAATPMTASAPNRGQLTVLERAPFIPVSRNVVKCQIRYVRINLPRPNGCGLGRASIRRTRNRRSRSEPAQPAG